MRQSSHSLPQSPVSLREISTAKRGILEEYESTLSLENALRNETLIELYSSSASSLCTGKELLPLQVGRAASMSFSLLQNKKIMLNYLLFSSTKMMTGAPRSGVTAPRGIMPFWVGRAQSQLHSRAMTEPKSIVEGKRTR